MKTYPTQPLVSVKHCASQSRGHRAIDLQVFQGHAHQKAEPERLDPHCFSRSWYRLYGQSSVYLVRELRIWTAKGVFVFRLDLGGETESR